MQPITILGDHFIQNGVPARILAGAMHYFRIMPTYWRDRLTKLKAMGLNTVETYVAWNLHEPRPGQFDFTGQLDLARYLEIAAELGLNAIVRPGPYICSEWELGGLPAWLLRDPMMQLRCSYAPYLKAVDRFFDALLPRLEPLQAARGGPIVAMQVENEYGSYGDDKTYLRHLADGMGKRGIDCLLFTSDGPTDSMLQGGTLPDIFKVVNFDNHPTEAFAKLREYQPNGPLMCGEFWCGWFDHWGEHHHTRPVDDVARDLDTMLAAGASVNFYMFHGGTNFGFMSGANHTATEYQPDVTSYDYDALLDEAGDPTPKYYVCREVIAKYEAVPALPSFPPVLKRAYGKVELLESAPLLANLGRLARPVDRPAPVPMETLGQNTGLILYRAMLQGPHEQQPLVLQDAHDRAQIFVDGVYQGLIDRNMPVEARSLPLAFGPGAHQIDILVECMGRVNYGPQLHDRKGITEGVRLANQFLYDWTIYPLPLTNLSRLCYGGAVDGPAFHRGFFEVDDPADTWLALPGWTRGLAWINGFNLGWHWEEKGPQHTLYVPAPKLQRGRNELIVLELGKQGELSKNTHGVEFLDKALLG